MRNRILSVGSLWVTLALLSACSMAAQRGSSGARDVITADQMVASGARTAYEAVERLQPGWLTARGPQSMTNATPAVPDVYIGGNNVGDVDYLRGIDIVKLSEIRYYEAGEASARFGMGHPRGVIDVILKGVN